MLEHQVSHQLSHQTSDLDRGSAQRLALLLLVSSLQSTESPVLSPLPLVDVEGDAVCNVSALLRASNFKRPLTIARWLLRL